jgi:hypothetical protein
MRLEKAERVAATDLAWRAVMYHVGRRPRRARGMHTVLAVSLLAVALSACSVALSHGETVAIPQLSTWERQMLTYGQKHGAAMLVAKDSQSADARLSPTYYDAARVYYQIGDYTRDPKWYAYADAAVSAYRRYVMGTKGEGGGSGSVPGYWNFSTGLRMHFERTGDAASKEAVIKLSEKEAYSTDTTPLQWTAGIERSREVAYVLTALVNAEALGAPPRKRRVDLVNQAYGHIDQWSGRQSWKGKDAQVAPFMCGLTAEALILDWQQTKDPRLIPALSQLAKWMWAEAWVARDASMVYEANPHNKSGRSPKGAPDLNLLIAPLYAFLYAQTGEATYREQGDALFAGGVRSAYLVRDKQFMQSFRWSFDYVRWRGGTVAAAPPPSTLSATPSAPPPQEATPSTPAPQPGSGTPSVRGTSSPSLPSAITPPQPKNVTPRQGPRQ